MELILNIRWLYIKSDGFMRKIWFMYIWGVLGKVGGEPQGIEWSLEIVMTWIKVNPGDQWSL